MKFFKIALRYIIFAARQLRLLCAKMNSDMTASFFAWTGEMSFSFGKVAMDRWDKKVSMVVLFFVTQETMSLPYVHMAWVWIV